MLENLIIRADILRNRIIKLGFASSEDIKGCSQDEILALETSCGLKLPDSYKVFLSYFGHSCGGRVMSDIEYKYKSLLSLQEEWQRLQSFDCFPKIPANTFLWSTRYREQFMFFEVVDPEIDPVIFYWSDDDNNFRKVADSIFEILDEEIMVVETTEYYCRERSSK